MTKDLDAKIDEGFADFIAQAKDGKAMNWCFIPVYCLDELKVAATEGNDHEALNCLHAICNWSAIADQAYERGHHVACCYCDIEITHGEVHAFMTLIPIAAEGTGLAAAYCQTCAKRPRDELYQQCKQAINEQFGELEIADLQ
jgi:hypothetical protein